MQSMFRVKQMKKSPSLTPSSSTSGTQYTRASALMQGFLGEAATRCAVGAWPLRETHSVNGDYRYLVTVVDEALTATVTFVPDIGLSLSPSGNFAQKIISEILEPLAGIIGFIPHISLNFTLNTCITAAQYGTLFSEYEVSEYWDLRSSAGGSTPMRAYIIRLKQRLTLYNENANNFNGLLTPDTYAAYPLLAVQGVVPAVKTGNLNFYLEDYSPKTLNASVSTSQSQGTDSQNSSSYEHMSGSSTSVTNSFEVSDSVGFFGGDPTGSVSASIGTSTTNTSEQSQSASSGHQLGLQSSSSASMSVKDWACYAFLDANRQRPTWVWGQEYPWDIIRFRSSDATSGVGLPQYVKDLLWDSKFLYPPSQISQFGLNFVGQAKWIFFPDGTPGSDDETVSFTHNLTYWQGSHSASSSQPLMVAMQPIASNKDIETITLNLPVLALEPIVSSGSRNGAIIGFVPSEFFLSAGQSKPFRLKSNVNNVYITNGTGFAAQSDDDSVLTASNITESAPASMTIQFKAVNPNLELTLYLKNWKTTSTACKLKFTINGQDIYRTVDSEFASTGDDNLTRVQLRVKDYVGSEYYDYLVMGLNTINLTITPADGASSCGYALRAIALQ
ncbi:hypothetical protein DFQ28_000390 [Apophysomyces sp. BC1034]|nr:hypothetical protein DFQ28_000390 [Apophysomyces sp. BC1034]